MYIGQMDVRMGRTSMQMYLENLETEIEQTRQEITAKKRIGNWLGVMSGLVSGHCAVLRNMLSANQTGGIHDDRCYFQNCRSRHSGIYFEPGIKTQWERGTGVFDQFCGSDPGVVLGASLIYELFASMKRLFSL